MPGPRRHGYKKEEGLARVILMIPLIGLGGLGIGPVSGFFHRTSSLRSSFSTSVLLYILLDSWSEQHRAATSS